MLRDLAGKELYHHGNHPIKWVRLTGVIVAVDNFSGKTIFTLDDSSGMCMECTCPGPLEPTTNLGSPSNPMKNPAMANGVRNPARTTAKKTAEPPAPSVATPLVPWDDVDVGAVVKVKGRVGTDWGRKRIEVIKIEIIRSTNQEVRCWDEVVAFRQDILRNHWVVTEVEEEAFRKVAMREKKWKSREGMGKGTDVKVLKAVAEERRQRRHKETDEQRRKRKGKDSEKFEPASKRRKDQDGEGFVPQSKNNYPSSAVRRGAAGKYEALGI